MHEYSIKYRKGIHDLKPEYAFRGNSQGDESVSNILEDYLNSQGWMSPTLDDCPLVQEEIDKRIAENREWNRVYIEKLKRTGEYEEEYTVGIKIGHNPLFDNPEVRVQQSLQSYKFITLNLNQDNEDISNSL